MVMCPAGHFRLAPLWRVPAARVKQVCCMQGSEWARKLLYQMQYITWTTSCWIARRFGRQYDRMLCCTWVTGWCQSASLSFWNGQPCPQMMGGHAPTGSACAETVLRHVLTTLCAETHHWTLVSVLLGQPVLPSEACTYVKACSGPT